MNQRIAKNFPLIVQRTPHMLIQCLWLRFQVDIFVVDSVFLGKLTSIRIGHSETKLGMLSPSTCLKVVLILVGKSSPF